MAHYAQPERAQAQKSADGGTADQLKARDQAVAGHALDESARSGSLMQLRAGLDRGPGVQAQSELARALNTAPIQREPNNTGLPDQLKSGIETLSGLAMDDVRVHYNSSKPAAVQAHAYAQGTDIHIAPGQEKHLPHEAWHVVQQKQGRVKPTLQLKGVAINDQIVQHAAYGTLGAPIQRITIDGQKIATTQALSKHINENKEYIEGADKFLASLTKDPEKEIVDRLVVTNYEYDTEHQFFAEVDLRANLVAGIRLINQLKNFDYDHKNDFLTVPSEHWDVIPAFQRGNEEPENVPKKKEDKQDEKSSAQGYAFKPKGQASKVISSIFEQGKNYFIECNTALLLVHYHALHKTLGDDLFDRYFGSALILIQEHLAPKKGVSASEKIGSQKHIPEIELDPKAKGDPLEQLVPGDGVYFVNYPEYEVRHPLGAFAGEWGFYLGDGKFAGFGVDDRDFNGMVQKLKEAYNSAPTNAEAEMQTKTKKEIPGTKDKREKATTTPTLDGEVPGIAKGIRRMASSSDIKDKLAGATFLNKK